MSKNRKPVVTFASKIFFRLSSLLFFLIVIYVLISGPIFAIAVHHPELIVVIEDEIFAFYAPLIWVAQNTFVGPLLRAYLDLWAGLPF
ncbi:hypothetical protein Enr17x_28680 [Gimesia fumaroli]|uniref:Uncharacterized protein n=1 Tax=Gimesia fumaroli TaxID=2527976 RepID=A0A518ICL4_9PLAN|nr:hypothetical protein Enr17x_28680 [Gimesia fumaroli]